VSRPRRSYGCIPVPHAVDPSGPHLCGRITPLDAPAPPTTRVRRTARLAQHLAAVYASAVWRAPRLEAAGRRELAARFAREMLDALEVRLHVRGTPREGTPVLLVANHVSWLDMYVLNAVAGARFVATSEVRGW